MWSLTSQEKLEDEYMEHENLLKIDNIGVALTMEEIRNVLRQSGVLRKYNSTKLYVRT